MFPRMLTKVASPLAAASLVLALSGVALAARPRTAGHVLKKPTGQAAERKPTELQLQQQKVEVFRKAKAEMNEQHRASGDPVAHGVANAYAEAEGAAMTRINAAGRGHTLAEKRELEKEAQRLDGKAAKAYQKAIRPLVREASSSYANSKAIVNASREELLNANRSGDGKTAHQVTILLAREKLSMLNAKIFGLQSKAERAALRGGESGAKMSASYAQRISILQDRAAQLEAKIAKLEAAGPRALKSSYGDVKAYAEQGSLGAAQSVLNRMEAKANSGNFIQRAINKVQLARARRALRRAALGTSARVVDGYASQVAAGNMSVYDAKQALKTDNHLRQADKALGRLARQQKTGPVQALVAKLRSFLPGANSLESGIKGLQKRANQRAKEGPEGALAAEIMLSQANLMAKHSVNPAKFEKKSKQIHDRAIRNLESTIAVARKDDPMTVMLAYTAMESLRLDVPGPRSQAEIQQEIMTKYKDDFHSASLGALEQLSKLSDAMSKMGFPEVKQEAGNINRTALSMAGILRKNNVQLPKNCLERLEKTDARLNGRDTFRYKVANADNVVEKAGVVASTAVKVALSPLTKLVGFAKHLKSQGMSPAVLEQKMQGLVLYTRTYMSPKEREALLGEANGAELSGLTSEQTGGMITDDMSQRNAGGGYNRMVQNNQPSNMNNMGGAAMGANGF